ncbi:YbjN domain-containing protein [Stakelama sp. CBK3Z-3]|uniref:YbjN domain-containing protein n=1 Tax=Stakelama flava TaxID=2860338 RepID=A0ABS6XGM4_9SPHN|nr:YbjN domain-containing protein [Stakelama flava]MBW4329366.1 YbjN domain-containing protein [Stakelama flava]
MRKGLAAAIFLTGAVLGAAPSGAQQVMPVRTRANITADPDALARLVRAEGYKVTIDHTDDGNPFLQTDVDGTPFTIFLNNCIAGKACRTVQFYAGFSVSTPRKLDLINRWNQQKRFAKAYIDDQNDPRLEMDINMAGGGVARGNFVENFRVWIRLLAAFKQHIGWNDAEQRDSSTGQ